MLFSKKSISGNVNYLLTVSNCFIWRNKKTDTNTEFHNSCNASSFVNLVFDLSHQLYNHWTGNSKEESNLWKESKHRFISTVLLVSV